MGSNRRSSYRLTVSRNTRGTSHSFKFGINGLALIFLIELFSTLAIIDLFAILFVNDIDLQLWRANLQLERGYEIPDRIIFEPSVLVYNKDITVRYLEPLTETPHTPSESYGKLSKPITNDKNDIYLLALLVQAEAGIEGPDGKRRVVDVVLNRVESPKFPNTVKDVIFQPGQFTTADLVLIWWKKTKGVSETTTKLVYSELYGERIDKQSLYFALSPVTNKGLYQFGRHYFSY